MTALATVGDELALVRILESLPPDDRRVVETALGYVEGSPVPPADPIVDKLSELEDDVERLNSDVDSVLYEIRGLRKKLERR